MLARSLRACAPRPLIPAFPRACAACRASSSAPAPPVVPASLVKALREQTGAPMMDCRNALVAEGNDVARAVDWLRKKGVAAASKKAGRVAANGLVAALVADAGDAGVLLEVRRGRCVRVRECVSVCAAWCVCVCVCVCVCG